MQKSVELYRKSRLWHFKHEIWMFWVRAIPGWSKEKNETVNGQLRSGRLILAGWKGGDGCWENSGWGWDFFGSRRRRISFQTLKWGGCWFVSCLTGKHFIKCYRNAVLNLGIYIKYELEGGWIVLCTWGRGLHFLRVCEGCCIFFRVVNQIFLIKTSIKWPFPYLLQYSSCG